MEKIIEQIWSYGTLALEEREEIESYVLSNPQYAPVLEDSKSMHAVIMEAGILASDPVDEIAMAYLVAHNQMHSGVAPDMLNNAYKLLIMFVFLIEEILSIFIIIQMIHTICGSSQA